MAEHVTSRKTYFAIFAALLILTYATIVVARIDPGRFNTIVALTIAVTKAVLVVLFRDAGMDSHSAELIGGPMATARTTAEVSLSTRART